ncbi:MAG: hypothetical protein H7Y04_08530, partial [Verrucomicrobia bacterium]|nr:hypothetical protein [Cytophagales bacterium]
MRKLLVSLTLIGLLSGMLTAQDKKQAIVLSAKKTKLLYQKNAPLLPVSARKKMDEIVVKLFDGQL